MTNVVEHVHERAWESPSDIVVTVINSRTATLNQSMWSLTTITASLLFTLLSTLRAGKYEHSPAILCFSGNSSSFAVSSSWDRRHDNSVKVLIKWSIPCPYWISLTTSWLCYQTRTFLPCLISRDYHSTAFNTMCPCSCWEEMSRCIFNDPVRHHHIGEGGL